MNFTFGIVTSPNTCSFLQEIVDSIVSENIPNYEIIVIGGAEEINEENLKIIPFDETKKSMWITKKKNLITQYAKYENIVYFHDYVKLNRGWYSGFLTFGNDFNVCMTKIVNIDGSRFRDWTLCHEDAGFLNNREFLIPYDMTHLSKLMYISGAYWIAKKNIMEKYPLDETLSWGESEDIKWSRQVRNEIDFSMNINSGVSLLKWKDPAFLQCSQETIEKLKNIKP